MKNKIDHSKSFINGNSFINENSFINGCNQSSHPLTKKQRRIGTKHILPFLILILLIVSSIFVPFDKDQVEEQEDIFITDKRADIIVDVNGNGDYTTIQAGIGAANPGDTVYVWEGTYNEYIVIGKSRITLIGNGSANTTIDGGGADEPVIHIYNSFTSVRWVNISGFTVTNSGSTNSGILLRTFSDNVVEYCNISNCNVSSNGGNGIYLNRAEYNTIWNNTMFYNGDHGIEVSGWSGVGNNNTVKNNNCSNNNFDGILIMNSNNNTIVNNICYNNGFGIYITGGAGDDKSLNNIVDNNTVMSNLQGIIIEDQSNNNTISNNTCYDNGDGIVIRASAENNTIENNTCYDNYGNDGGIYIDTNSENNIIKNNNCFNNKKGINIINSNNNYVVNNTCSDNDYGIFLQAEYNTISNNTMTECGIYVYGYSLSYYNTHTIDTLNTVNNKPVYYYKNTTSVTVPSDAGEVIFANVTDSSASDLDMTNGTVSVIIAYSDNITIDNCDCSNNTVFGIMMWDTDNTTIENNNCSNNYNGIRLGGGYLDNNTIQNNICSYNSEYGIVLYSYSENTTVKNNNCSYNNDGIYLSYADNNNITYNNLTNNNNYGIEISESNCENNLIHHNNFINNNGGGVQASDNGTNNIWNNSYPSGGNYWDDQTSPDSYQGANQDVLGSDGIVDLPGGGKNPYVLDGSGGSQDEYPLTDETAIPEFSDFVIPMVGMLVMFMIVKRKKRK